MNDLTQNQCPDCHRALFFSADGRSKQCEVCGYKLSVPSPRRTAKELIRALSLFTEYRETDDASQSGVRILLAQGIAAVKAGNRDEAYYALSRVLRRDATNEQFAQAWLWLSELFPDPIDKRDCLEQVLAYHPANGIARRGLAILDGRLKTDEIINPDKVKAAVFADPLTADAEKFACPRCDGAMKYTPDGQLLGCEFCGYVQALGHGIDGDTPKQFGEGKFEQEFTTALATARGHLQPINMRALQCQSCAVEFVLPPETLSITCPYCDSVYVTETAESHEIMPPHAVIPFANSEEDARQALRLWFEKHKIERPRVSPIVGLYLPVWTFDIGGELKWSGLVQKGDNWVPASGNKLFFADDELVPASRKLPSALTKGFQDYDLKAIEAYDSRYLADWPAERYQISLADASLAARKQLFARLRKRPSAVTGRYETFKDLRLHSHGLVVESFKLLLLPMWIAHYEVDGLKFDVCINGQTGFVRGERKQGMVGKMFSWLRGE